MKFLPLALLCLSLPCGFSAGHAGASPDAPASFPINLDKTPEGGSEGNGDNAPMPDQSTPFNAANFFSAPCRKKRTGAQSRTSPCPPRPHSWGR